MVKREIISLHLGQAGIQTANAMWELYCIEHCIDPDGLQLDDSQDEDFSYETFFEKTENLRYVPRAIFMDTENILIDEIASGAYRKLYHPLQLIKGTEDGANNFARGCFTISRQHIAQLLERVRRAIELCNNPEGFLLTHSLGGGTGSGFTSIVTHSLEAEFAKYNRVQVSVFPGQVLASSVVEPYNSLLHIHTTIETVDLSLMFGNEALYDMCSNLLFMPSPHFSHVNRLMALITSSSTAGMRFKGQLNNDLGELQTNLVPYPRIHYPLLRYAPIHHYSKTGHLRPTIANVTKDVFNNKYQTIKTDSSRGRYIAVVLNYRGNLSQHDINQTVQSLRANHEIDFVDWCPTGFKIGMSSSVQTVVPDSQVALYDFTVSMMANTTSMKEAWLRLSRKFLSLYQHRAFVHWFIDEGMEEEEFADAYDNILMLIEDYNECCLTKDDIDNILGQLPTTPMAKPGKKLSEPQRPQKVQKEISQPSIMKEPPLQEPPPLGPPVDSRMMLRRHSSRSTTIPDLNMLRRYNRKHNGSISSHKPNRIEKKFATNRTPSQKANTAYLLASTDDVVRHSRRPQ